VFRCGSLTHPAADGWITTSLPRSVWTTLVSRQASTV
jgi:hypothetical protein